MLNSTVERAEYQYKFNMASKFLCAGRLTSGVAHVMRSFVSWPISVTSRFWMLNMTQSMALCQFLSVRPPSLSLLPLPPPSEGLIHPPTPPAPEGLILRLGWNWRGLGGLRKKLAFVRQQEANVLTKWHNMPQILKAQRDGNG